MVLNGFDSIPKIASPITKSEFETVNPGNLIDTIFDTAMTAYEQKSERLCDEARPVIDRVLENEGDKYENMMLPVGDNTRSLRIIINLANVPKAEFLNVKLKKRLP